MYDAMGTVPDRRGSHFSVGQEIPVVYLAEKPQIARYRDYDDMGEMKWVFVLSCVLCLLVGGTAVFALVKEKVQKDLDRPS